MDYFYFFFHIALDYAKNKGTISFITTNYYLTATYADKLRRDFQNRSSLKTLINFNELKVFESALGQHNIITILEKGYNPQTIIDCRYATSAGAGSDYTLRKILSNTPEGVAVSLISNEEIYEGKSLYIRMTKQSSNTNQNNALIFQKIIAGSETLGTLCTLVEGIHTGADKVSDSHLSRFDIKSQKGKGIFVLSNAELKELSLDEQEKKIIKPWYKNSDIDRWVTAKKTDKHLIYYTTKGNFKFATKIQKHLSQFKLILINRKTRSGTGLVSEKDYDEFIAGKKYISYVMNASAFKNGEYYCVSYPREQEVFEGNKIVVPQRSPKNTFAYCEGSWYASADVYFITKKSTEYDLKYILGLLNSKLYFYWLFNKGKRKGDILELYIRPLSEIPIKKISDDEQKPIIKLVERILSAKAKNPQANISQLEEEIDQLVYQLYGLTEEEKNIVEGKS